jgi:hypothetical protein
VHVANFSGVARCARYCRKVISSGLVKHAIAGLCNDLHSLRDYQMARVDVCDFSVSLGIDRHQIATVSSNLVAGRSNLRAYPSVTYHGLFVSGICDICTEGTTQPPCTFVLSTPDLLQSCPSYLNQGSSDVVIRYRHMDFMGLAIIVFRNNIRSIVS